MAKSLVIVESPAKAKTIEKFLGKSHYTVKASVGHVRDLPKSQLGVDIENNFEPKYINIRGKGDVIKELKKEAKKAKKVYLATDPDREGEAISWHLSYILNIDEEEKCRIEFNEITKDAIKKAIKSPRNINLNLVDAQQARRVLDRLLGYQISPILWQKVRKGLSAGRVQSVTTKLICEREEEIKAFVPKEYWSIELIASNKEENNLTLKFYGKNNEKIELENEEQVKEILKDPYIFDMLTFTEEYDERDIELGLIKHIEKFLVEMGAGFAFMGRQYHIEVSEKDFYIDILMYNAFMHRYLVVELKRGEFQPEYIGKLNFYCSAVDDILCREGDNPTIGLLLCQNKDQIMAEYALRDVHKPIGISDYELGQALPKDIKSGLPSIEELENKLSRDLQDIDNKE